MWLLGEAHAHRMPDVVLSAEPVDDDVILTLRPDKAWEWDVWSNLLQVDDGRTTHRGGCVTAHGDWRGTHVVLVGRQPGMWAAS